MRRSARNTLWGSAAGCRNLKSGHEDFEDRHEAGRLLAQALLAYAVAPMLVVLGLRAGGVPVAFEVARRLRAPLDVCVVRKLGVPGQEELAMGAVAAGDTVVVNREVIDSLGISDEVIKTAAEREASEVARRERMDRDGRDRLEVGGRTILLIYDGLATGATMAAAVLAMRQQNPANIVVAAPAGALHHRGDQAHGGRSRLP